MSCQVENYKNYDAPAVAGNFRALLGLLSAFAGLYAATLTNIRGHGLGVLLFLVSPFVILTDKKRTC